MSVAVPQEAPLTYADLQKLPDDGNRYELLDGFLLQTPPPAIGHQDIVLGLGMLLRRSAPPEQHVLIAPVDWKVSETTSFEPDVLVARRVDVGRLRLERTPLLAVEVLSPGTRVRDLTIKRAAYERAGLHSYWLIDPDEPRLTVLELRDIQLVEVASVGGDETFAATQPFAVEVVPARLLA